MSRLFLLVLSCFLSTALHICFASPNDFMDKAGISPPASVSNHKVLIIYSYHNSLPWQADIRSALFNRLKSIPSKHRPEIYEEHFDAHRFHNQKNHHAFLDFLQKKYRDTDLDLIITESEIAYEFLKNHPKFFQNVPRQYIISDSNPNSIVKDKNTLQVFPDIQEAVSTVTEVLPELNKIIVIRDLSPINFIKLNDSKTIEVFQVTELIAPLAKQNITLEIWQDFSFKTLYEKVSKINSKNTTIFYLPVGSDNLGEHRIPKEVLQDLVKLSPVPIFIHHDSLLNTGVVGGYVLSAKKLGDLMADVILGLPLPKTRAEIDAAAKGYYFDDNALKRWNIQDKLLPPESMIINRKQSDWYRYRLQITGFFLAIVFELLLIVALFHNLRLRKKVTLALTQERDLLEQRVKERTQEISDNKDFISSILNSLTAHIAVLDENGNIININKAWKFFADSNDLPEEHRYNLGENYFEVCQKAYTDEHLKEAMMVQYGIMSVLEGEKESYYFEYACHSPNKQRWFFMRVLPLYGNKKGAVVVHENITERKQAEIDLHNNEKLLRASINAISQPFAIINTFDCSIVLANKAYGAGEIAGQKCYSVSHHLDQQCSSETHPCPLTTVLENNKSFSVEHLHTDAKGNLRNIDIHAYPVYDDDGNITQIVEYCMDITERKQMELQLINERQRFAEIIKGTNVGTWEWNVQTGAVIFNERWAEIIGYTLEELSPTDINTWIRFSHPDDLAKSETLLKKHFAGELEYYEFEGKMRHKNGSWIWVLDRGCVSSWTEDGKPLMMYGSHQDITKRKQVEQQLAENKLRLQMILDTEPECIKIVDKDDRLRLMSKAGLRMVEADSFTEVENRCVLDLIAPEYQLAYQKLLKRVIAGEKMQMEYEVVGLKGRRRWLETHAVPMRDTDGSIVHLAVTRDISDRKQFEQALSRSEARLNEAQRIAKIGSWEWDLVQNQLYWSDEIYRLFEIDKNHFNASYRRFLKTVHPDDRKIIDKAYLLSLKTKQPYEITHRLQMPDGRIKYVYQHGETHFADDGKPLVSFGTVQDITARKQMEEALRERERQFRTLISNIPGTSYRCKNDKHWTMLYLSEDMENLTGYPVNDFLNNAVRSYESIIYEEDTLYVTESIATAIALKESWEIKYRIYHKNGDIRWVQEKGRAVFDNEKIRYLDGFIYDVTEQTLTELKKQTLILRNQMLMDNAADGIHILNGHGQIIEANQSFCKFLGYSPEEVLKLKISDWDTHVLESQILEVVKKSLKSQRTFETVFKCKDGRLVDAEVSTAGIELEGKKYIYAVSRDISERKQAEKALLEAKTTAEKATKTKSEFLSNMSHEIRTPMNAIINLVKLSLEETDSDKQHYYLSQVVDSSELLLNIINDILDFSKLEAGKLSVDKKPFHLEKLLKNLKDIFSLKAEEKGIKLDFIQNDDVPVQLIGDDLRLKQILINLINNAIKFTQQGSVTIQVALIARSQTDFALLKFSIIDTGIGIAADKLPQLFEAFTQAETSTTRQFGGSGLGLTISKCLVELLGGKLDATSTLNEGSCFYFQLPFQIAKNLSTQSQDTSKETIDLKGLHLLAVEDNPTNRLVLKVILELQQISFDMAENGQQALDYLQQNDYAAILMDVQMPVMNGIDATKAIRSSNQAYKNIPIIAMTAYALKEEKQKILNSGMNAYVSKPLDKDELFKALKQCLSHK